LGAVVTGAAAGRRSQHIRPNVIKSVVRAIHRMRGALYQIARGAPAVRAGRPPATRSAPARWKLPPRQFGRRRGERRALYPNVRVDDRIIIDVDFPVIIEVAVEPAARACSDVQIDAAAVVDVQLPVEIGVAGVGVHDETSEPVTVWPDHVEVAVLAMPLTCAAMATPIEVSDPTVASLCDVTMPAPDQFPPLRPD
jgi:hypothetical protein